MDMTASIAPKSDQLNAEDLLSGPRTFTIEKVEQGTAEQPVNVHLVEFPGRPFKPSKTVRRLMVAAWGPDTATYPGKRMTLYRDPAVKFGGMDVGGIRVSHMSGIEKRIVVALTVTRGKRAPYTVDPLPAAAPPISPESAPEPKLSARTRGRLFALFTQKGAPESEQLAYIAHVIGRTPTHRDAINEDEFARVVHQLEGLPDAPAAAAD